MKKASTRLLEQETQTPSPAPDLIPAESSTENLHWDWYSKRGHFIPTNQLHANPHNPRMLFDKLPLDVLRESISRVGILANCAHFNQGEQNTILSYCSRADRRHPR